MSALALTALAFSRPGVDVAEVQAANERIAGQVAQEEADASAAREAAVEATRTHFSYPPVGEPLNVLFVGDSITYGLYASTQSASYASLLTEHLAEGGEVKPTTVAAPGRTVVDSLNAKTPVDQDLTFVLLGNNDISKLDLPTFKAKYQELLTRLHSESPQGKIVCVSPFVDSSYGPDYVAAEVADCKAAGARFVDIRHITRDPANHSVVGTPWFGGVAEDTSHPSDKGHAAISEAISQTLVAD